MSHEEATAGPRFDALPPEWPHELLPAIQARIAIDQRALVVLDDDPTGTQTVYDLPVLADWSVETLRAQLARAEGVFYILTNSRSMPAVAAAALNREIGRNLARAAQQAGRKVVVVSRSDSTLRGHFPGEVAALAAGLGVGIVMAYLSSPFYPLVLETFIQALQATGRQALVFTAAANQEIDTVLPLALEYRVDALIVTSATLSSKMVEECARVSAPSRQHDKRRLSSR